MYGRALLFATLATLAFASCNNGAREVAPYFGGGGSGGHAAGVGGDDLMLDAGGPKGPPPADASDLCGNQLHMVTTSPPNVYFVFDISGSMGTPVGTGTRFSVVQAAAAKMVTNLRHVIRAGAAAFPLGTSDACQPGGQIYPITFGDPKGFNNATHNLVPSGGTPTAATLVGLGPLLAAIPGKTVVVLATDGGPNCNPAAACDISDCQENIEGCFPGDTCCAMQVNCCAPSGPAGPGSCIDHQATVQAVAGLWAAGVKVYVVGIPGSQPYAKVLTDMALAGGAPQLASPFYYEVDDLSGLGVVLTSIATANISCDITIDAPPQDPSYTNVYFDQTVVLSDPINGWSWTSTSSIRLNGVACDKLKSGAVTQVQVVSGCPTEVSK